MAKVDVARLTQFARFCAVGAVGFVVDAGVLHTLPPALGIDPVRGRLISFSVAVLTTFELNRRWAFRSRGSRPYSAALMNYLSVQGFGFACNFAIYTSLYLMLPRYDDTPVVFLAAASAFALVVNYAGASALVFRPKGGRAEGGTPEHRL